MEHSRQRSQTPQGGSTSRDAAGPAPTASPFSLLNLQESLGNQALLGLLASGRLQAKLAVNQPGDAYEQEADRVAQEVVSAPMASAAPAVQRKSAGESGPATAPPVVHEALGSSGQPLDPTARAFLEPRFGRSFEDVRVHTGERPAEAARSIDALAFTVGRDVVFNDGQYAPGTAEGRRLLAHELTHVVQQGTEGRPAVVQRQTIPEAKDLGDAKTTSPIAKLSPQRQMNEELDRELAAIARGRILLPWIDERMTFTLDDVMADPALLAKLDLSKDKALRDRIYPFKGNKLPEKTSQLFTETSTVDDILRAPTSKGEIKPVMDLLVLHGALIRLDTEKFMASITRVEAKLERDRFDSKAAQIEQFAVDFKKRVARRDQVNPIVETEVIASGWAAGTKKERKTDTDAEKTRKELEKKLESAPATGPKRAALEKRLASAKRKEARAKGYRTFAKPVVRLLERLRARNDKWRAGTYPHHWWSEFSADIFLSAKIEKDGFWKQDAVRKFFEDLNAACEDSSPPGKFAWKAIYNDSVIRAEMDKLYGAGRVLEAPGHGPDKLHIHLDLRPLTVTKDDVTGYEMEEEHVVLPEPAPPATPAAKSP